MIKFLLFLVFKISSLPNNGLSLPGRSTFANPEHLCILDLLLLSAERRLGTLQLPGIFTCLAPGALLSLFFACSLRYQLKILVFDCFIHVFYLG